MPQEGVFHSLRLSRSSDITQGRKVAETRKLKWMRPRFFHVRERATNGDHRKQHNQKLSDTKKVVAVSVAGNNKRRRVPGNDCPANVKARPPHRNQRHNDDQIDQRADKLPDHYQNRVYVKDLPCYTQDY